MHRVLHVLIPQYRSILHDAYIWYTHCALGHSNNLIFMFDTRSARLDNSRCSLTDETEKSLGHIHILIEKRLRSWQIAFRSYVTWKLSPTERYMQQCSEGKGPKTLNRLGFWFPAGSASLCLQTFDDKWPSVHLRWEFFHRNTVIDSFFTKRLNRKKFLPDSTAYQTEPAAKDICRHCHNCHCLHWLIHEQYVV